ncbi:MAG: HD domain-containing protein [Spirochaetia bacterium]|nr:HD domain-containing protein [Spirochaetia bacterium]
MNSTNDIKQLLAQSLTPYRIEHSISTSEYALFLAHRYNVDVDQQNLEHACLYHDICRELPFSELVEYAHRHTLEVGEMEYLYPVLLHGPVASDMMRTYPILNKEDMIQAVRWHSIGSIEMGIMGALLFCADYMELKRTYVSGQQRSDLLASESLEEITKRILTLHIAHMKGGDKEIAPSTLSVHSFLIQGGKFE